MVRRLYPTERWGDLVREWASIDGYLRGFVNHQFRVLGPCGVADVRSTSAATFFALEYVPNNQL
jgi:hypothetical protein